MTTETEVNDIEALLTIITREDLEGTIAQLRAAVNVFTKNPKPAIAENAKALIESVAKKAERITSSASAAHAALEELEKSAEAKALAKMHEREQKWDLYARHLKEQLASCNRELEQVRTSPQQGQAPGGFTQAPAAKAQPQLTSQQKTAVRETIRRSWLHLQDPISYLIRLQQPITIDIIKQTIPLERLGIHYSVHDIIYRATYKALLDEREKYRANPHGRLYDHIYEVHHVMMNAVGY